MRFATIFVLLERKSTTVNIFSNNDYIKSQKRRDKWQKSGMKKFSNEYVGYLRMLSTMNAIKILHSRHTFFRTSNNPNTIFDFLPFGSTVHTPSEKWKKETNWNNIEVDSSKNTFIHSFIGGRLTLARGQNYLCYEFCGVTPWDPENREERKEKIVVRLFPVTFLHICKILRQPPPCLFAFFFRLVRLVVVRACERKRQAEWLTNGQHFFFCRHLRVPLDGRNAETCSHSFIYMVFGFGISSVENFSQKRRWCIGIWQIINAYLI